jgi:dihydrofolate reductase
MTMKLTTTTFVSVDGVMQGIGAPDEDRSGGFERGGWTTPLWDNEAATFLNEVYGRADAFLFGRRTYEIFSGSWGAVADPGINPIAAALNSRPKYVASTTLTNPGWANTTVLSSEVAAAVGELRGKPGGELQGPDDRSDRPTPVQLGRQRCRRLDSMAPGRSEPGASSYLRACFAG